MAVGRRRELHDRIIVRQHVTGDNAARGHADQLDIDIGAIAVARADEAIHGAGIEIDDVAVIVARLHRHDGVVADRVRARRELLPRLRQQLTNLRDELLAHFIGYSRLLSRRAR